MVVTDTSSTGRQCRSATEEDSLEPIDLRFPEPGKAWCALIRRAGCMRGGILCDSRRHAIINTCAYSIGARYSEVAHVPTSADGGHTSSSENRCIRVGLRNYAVAKCQELDSVSSIGVRRTWALPQPHPYTHRQRLISPRNPSIHQHCMAYPWGNP